MTTVTWQFENDTPYKVAIDIGAPPGYTCQDHNAIEIPAKTTVKVSRCYTLVEQEKTGDKKISVLSQFRDGPYSPAPWRFSPWCNLSLSGGKYTIIAIRHMPDSWPPEWNEFPQVKQK